MISSGVVLQSSQLSRLGINQQLLNEGSSVFVRVIADKGNGKYLGSVAGVRVNLSSNKSLAVGSSFVANISTKNGVIYVSPKSNDVVVERKIQLSMADNSQVAGLLESLGLNADELYVKILQQMKQQEMKLDTQLMYKLHNLALRFKGNEKQVAELLTAFAKKNENITEKDILQLLAYIEAYEEDCNNQNEENDNGKYLLNKLNKKDGGWFVVPFEIFNLQSDIILGKGTIRILFDSYNKIKLLNVCCVYNSKKYLFSLTFENEKCKKVRFNISSIKIDDVEFYLSKLRNNFLKKEIYPEIEWAEAFEIEGSASETEEFYAIGGSV